MKRIQRLVSVLIVAFCIAGTLAHAQDSSGIMQYSGTLPNFGSGKTQLKAGSYGVTFAIYPVASGAGAAVWQETQTVTVDSAGNYTAFLGAATPFVNSFDPSIVFPSGAARWLGVTFQTTSLARTLLTAVPYSLKSASAAKLGNKTLSDLQTLINTAVTGPTGPTGPTGATGANGATGATGPAG